MKILHLARLRQLSLLKKVMLAISAVLACVLLFIVGLCSYDAWSHGLSDDRASWEEIREAVAWVSESKDYKPAERFIESTGSSPLPNVTPDTPHEQLTLRISAWKCLAVDLMRTLSRQQVADIQKNRQLPYASLSPEQKGTLLTLARYHDLGGTDLPQADLQKATILVRVFRWRNGMCKTQFEWYIPTKTRAENYPVYVDLMMCMPGGLIRTD